MLLVYKGRLKKCKPVEIRFRNLPNKTKFTVDDVHGDDKAIIKIVSIKTKCTRNIRIILLTFFPV